MPKFIHTYFEGKATLPPDFLRIHRQTRRFRLPPKADLKVYEFHFSGNQNLIASTPTPKYDWFTQ